MKRILVNATQAEELRVAIVDGQRLLDLDLESGSREQRKANVYKGRITRVEPSLEAAFVDYGVDRHGFLPLKEISRELFLKDPGEGKINIKEVIREGQEILVQVEKEERGNKGAALTTLISLAGRYLVLMPNNPRAGGVSRRIEGDDRDELREALSAVEIPNGMGVIARTAGVGRSAEELQWDLNYLTELWEAMQKAVADRKAPFLVYQESNIIIRALRDYLRPDIGEIVVDSPEIHAQAQDFMQSVMPHLLPKLKLYEDTIPLFSRFQIESQIETAHQREVRLPSGGSLVIDHTEALTSIDINSAKATGGASIEETALNTNLEAADEIARQLRLRDLGGLIVIDFIDMGPNKHQREVENRLRDATKLDRARLQTGRISRFGLLELSRQRLRPSLREHSHLVCPRCLGQGTTRTVESLALQILRLIEEEALKDRTARIIAQLPVSVATFLLNEKRSNLVDIEARCGIAVSLVANPKLETPQYEIRRARGDQMDLQENKATSYELADHLDVASEADSREAPKPAAPKPAVSAFLPSQPAPPPPAPVAKVEPGLLLRLWQALLALFSPKPEPKPQKQPVRGNRNNRDRAQSRNRRGTESGARRDGSASATTRGRGRNQQNAKADSKSEARAESGGRQRKPNRERDTGADSKPATQVTAAKPELTKGPEKTDDSGSSEAGRTTSRRRGRRGGRRRRGGSERQEGGATSGNPAANTGTAGNPEQPSDNPDQGRNGGRSGSGRRAEHKLSPSDSQPGESAPINPQRGGPASSEAVDRAEPRLASARPEDVTVQVPASSSAIPTPAPSAAAPTSPAAATPAPARPVAPQPPVAPTATATAPQPATEKRTEPSGTPAKASPPSAPLPASAPEQRASPQAEPTTRPIPANPPPTAPVPTSAPPSAPAENTPTAEAGAKPQPSATPRAPASEKAESAEPAAKPVVSE